MTPKRIAFISDCAAEAEVVIRSLRDFAIRQGLVVDTLDRLYFDKPIVSHMWSLISLSDVVVAHIGKDSLNLYYEIGLAHGLGKPVLLIVAPNVKVPSDLIGQRYLRLDEAQASSSNLHFRIESIVRELLEKPTGLNGFRGPQEETTFQYLSSNAPDVGIRTALAVSREKRGEAIDKWFRQLASQIRQWEVVEPTQRESSDYNLAIWSNIDDPDFKALGNPIAIEVRSMGGTSHRILRDLVHKARSRSLRALVVISAGAVTKYTRRFVARLFREESFVLLIIDRDDLLSIETPADLVGSMRRQIHALLYGEIGNV